MWDMRPRPGFSFLLVPLLAGLVPLAAGESQWDNLLKDSPFGPGGEVTGQSGAPHAPVEFRGFVGEGPQRIFSIYEPASHRSFWLGENETAGSITVRRYDEAKSTLTVDYGSSRLNLGMSQAGRTSAAGLTVTPAAPGLSPVGSDPRAERWRKLSEEQSRRKAAELRLRDRISQQLEAEAAARR